MNKQETRGKYEHWLKFPLEIENRHFTLCWKPDAAGRMPELPLLRTLFWGDNQPPTITIGFQNGGYLDIDPGLRIYVDATGDEFVDGGGDCALMEDGNPTPLVLLSQVVEREREDRIASQNRLIELKENRTTQTLLRAREKQMWTTPGEDGGLYPPDHIKSLYGKKIK